jgi:hypothetical protein
VVLSEQRNQYGVTLAYRPIYKEPWVAISIQLWAYLCIPIQLSYSSGIIFGIQGSSLQELNVEKEETMTYLPSGFNAVEIIVEGACQDPDLRQAELTRHLDAGAPYIQGGLCTVERATTHVADCMLFRPAFPPTTINNQDTD